MGHCRRIRRGISAIWVAILIILLLLMAATSVEMGRIMLCAHQLQNAADAAALAAVKHVRESPEEAIDAAIQIAGSNFAAGLPVLLDVDLDEFNNDPDGEVVIGWYNRNADPGDPSDPLFSPWLPGSEYDVNAVLVRARPNHEQLGGVLPLLFAPLLGTNNVNLTRSAIAMVGGGTGEGLLALACGGCSVHLQGSVCLTVNDGVIHLNSDGTGSGPHAGCALCTTGNSYEIIAPQINSDGGGVCADNYDGFIDPNAGHKPDPLAYLTPPPNGPIQATGPVTVQAGESLTLNPGFYPGGIRILGGGTAYLNPGIYVLGKPPGDCGQNQMPAGLDVRGGGTLIGENVMIYLTSDPQDCAGNCPANDCSAEQESFSTCYLGAALDISANAYVRLTPPLAGLYEHVTIFQARNNVRKAYIGGGPGLDIEGALYFPANELELFGTGEGYFGNMVLAQRLTLGGSGCIEINYTGIIPSAGNIVFLVR